MTVVSAHADQVARRVAAIDVRKVILSILFLPFMLVGLVSRFIVRAVVFTFGWCWYALVEGWNMAAPKDQRT